ncbi:hypothetical protein L6232_20835, partial [Shewanella sp. C31]|nr:hypothetical protein [Shewanella electrica]
MEWLFARGEPGLVGHVETLEFLKDRYNRVLSLHGLPPVFPVEEGALRDTEWFTLELLADKEVDFFNTRSVAYARRVQSFD